MTHSSLLNKDEEVGKAFFISLFDDVFELEVLAWIVEEVWNCVLEVLEKLIDATSWTTTCCHEELRRA